MLRPHGLAYVPSITTIIHEYDFHQAPIRAVWKVMAPHESSATNIQSP